MVAVRMVFGSHLFSQSIEMMLAGDNGTKGANFDGSTDALIITVMVRLRRCVFLVHHVHPA